MFVMGSSFRFSGEQVSDSRADSDSLPERYRCAGEGRSSVADRANCRLGGGVEERWRERFGGGTVAALRESLEAVAARIRTCVPDADRALFHA